MHNVATRGQQLGTNRNSLFPNSYFLVPTMSKTCAQLVGSVSFYIGNTSKLSTHSILKSFATWKKALLSPATLHKFVMQLYPPFLAKITEAGLKFSPLSTPLIIGTKWVRKENQLIGQGG